ncbi:MAG: flippase activity-associated protein Agl23, partial [Microthrixaceae bacterium]
MAGGTSPAAGGTSPKAEPRQPSAQPGEPRTPEPDLFDRWFVPVALGILFVAAALRLPELALNPFHHDEGVNGFFTTNLVRDGIYRYDPANYHGPSLYYFALVSEILLGLTTEAMRLVPAVFGIVLVGLVFPLRRYLGSIAVLVAGALLAVSPGAVYVSRYFIHETLVVAFTIALVTSVVLYLDRRESKYLLAASVAAALLFTTKETAVITVGVLLIAVGAANMYLRLRSGQGFGRTEAADRRRPTARAASRAESVWINGVEYRPARSEASRSNRSGATLSIPGEQVAGAAVVFLVIYILLFSSFFTNFPVGLADSLAAYVFWFQHGD